MKESYLHVPSFEALCYRKQLTEYPTTMDDNHSYALPFEGYTTSS